MAAESSGRSPSPETPASATAASDAVSEAAASETAEAASTEAPQPAAAGRLAKLTPANMLRSMLPLVIIVLALAYFCTPQNVDPVTEVDPSSSIRYAASFTDLELLVPDLPEGWRSTSVEVAAPPDGQPGPVTLTIGYVTPTDEFARYVVSTDPAAGLIEDLVNDAEEVGSVTLGGQAWTELRTDRGERLYLRTDGDLRLAVTGSASADELRSLAESLGPYRP